MNIGIMSMQRVRNYGSFMQALGLKTEIERLGHNVSFVDFEINPGFSAQKWKNCFPFYSLRKIKDRWEWEISNRQPSVFKECDQVLGLSDKLQLRKKVDVLVIGSDEVFNYIQNNLHVGYAPELLGAHNRAKKVISYAASCGNLTIEKIQQINKTALTAKLLKRFRQISVRDKYTGELVYKLVGRAPEYHLDPVLVAEYDDIFVDNLDLENYILIYGYPGRFTEEEGRRIKEFAQQTERKLISIGGAQSFCDQNIMCSPLQVLAYFKHADCVITDTFHGTIFSVINHKPFKTIVRSDAADNHGNENKVLDLLERLGLDERQMKSMDHLAVQMNEPIDYDRVDAIRIRERRRTCEYLKNNLK